MRVGALIPAAGLSSRMGDFKPLLMLGPATMAERLIATLRSAGADEIVMVTGFQAERMERVLAGSGVTFIRNAAYAQSDMFASARLGLNELIPKCDRILFTPVDVPLFSPTTVKALLDSEADIACPTFHGRRGHPLLFSRDIAVRLLNDGGVGGMRGAIARCGVQVTEVPVMDDGILHDADTPQDFQRLLEMDGRK